MSVFSVHWGDCGREVTCGKLDLDKEVSLDLMDKANKAGKCSWEKGIKRTAEVWMWGKHPHTSQRKDGKPDSNELLMKGHCQGLLDEQCCIVDQ